MLVFEEKGKPGYPEKTLGAEKRTNNKLNPLAIILKRLLSAFSSRVCVSNIFKDFSLEEKLLLLLLLFLFSNPFLYGIAKFSGASQFLCELLVRERAYGICS